MRELEFLPSWYRRTRTRRRVVVLQSWVLAALIVGLGTWLVQAARNVRAREAGLATLNAALVQKQSEQRQLTELLLLRTELQAREQLIASLGLPVEMTRLLQTLDTVMPKEMSLIEFACDTQENVKQVASVEGARATKSDNNRVVERRLKARLVAVAPSDLDLANFLAGLTNIPFFEQVAVTYARDKSNGGYTMREFEVTFSMNLNQQPGS